MKKILFPTDFSEVATNAFVHALEFAKIVQAELVILHTFELPIYDNQFFPENYAVIYDSLELSQFEMFKDEIPKLRVIAEERHLSNIKMSHRLMDGDLLHNIKKSIKEDKIDFVIIGVFREMLTIPFLLAQIVFLVLGIIHLIKNKTNKYINWNKFYSILSSKEICRKF